MLERNQVFVFSPEGFKETAVLIAAARASANPVLSLAHLPPNDAEESLIALVSAQVTFSVAVSALNQATQGLLERFINFGLAGVVLQTTNAGLAESVAWCKARGIPALVEVTSLADAIVATQLDIQGLVVKGSESGGPIGEETTFILLQQILPRVKVPVIARGGIGLHSASACLAAGAAGIALDWQLALAEESSLSEEIKAKIARMDGSETAILGQELNSRYRAYGRIGEAAFFELKKLEETGAVTRAAWDKAVHDRVASKELLLVGQDAAFAGFLAERFRTVRGICRAIRREASRQLRVASRLNHLSEHGPLAGSHGTRFPILQGPMTRVSDTADFAVAVAEGGALPFLALALMRGKEVGKLLQETKAKAGPMPWGVGILGFVPKELRDEQLAEVMKYKPPFAVIAGGRPDMAKQYEAEGIHVYLHVPSPELLRNFLEAGARRIIFEGRECGGHVGPRTSFVLWDQMIRTILNHLNGAGANTKAEDYHMIFAGGIHDALSSAMVSAITAPLAERGVRVGVVIGTGYLFTEEIVKSGSITQTFQEEAVRCRQTVLVESGVGHATRCADSAFATAFGELKAQLLKEGVAKEEMREQLEGLNLGRLRIASKGIIRRNNDDGKAVYESATPEDVRREGMFMIGQVAALRDRVCTVEELHRDCCSGGAILNERVSEMLAGYRNGEPVPNSDIAIIGLSCVYPGANDLQEYWQNIQNKVYALGEIPAERFDFDVYFDGDRRAKDKIYSKWGGFIPDVVFDPVQYGMPPSTLPSIEPIQMVTLEMVQRALRDAGYGDRRYDRENTCCIVGTGGGVAEMGMAYGFRAMLPYFVDQAGGSLEDSRFLIEKLEGHLPEWTEDSFAGFLLNVLSGRVANRLDFGGTNFIVDAACATGLAALRHAVTELETRSSNVAVVAAADMSQTPFGYLCFAKTQALSPTGVPKVFDDAGDGIVISEGVAVTVLKRLDDAILDGDKIYGVIKSVGASSDGKDKGLTAPRPIGQIRAFKRAYGKAGFDPATIGLMEAHGTGTVVGDRTEAESLTAFLDDAGAEKHSVALGSVKSMIGHSKCAAGFAGLFKALMAARHHVLPPTLNVTKPNSKMGLDASPLYINSETRPWLSRLDGVPRRAGVSAFGFGGTNFHAVIEEYRSPDGDDPDDATVREYPAELFLWRGNSTAEIAKSLEQIGGALDKGAKPSLGDLAAAVYWEAGRGKAQHCLAIVATSLDDLKTKIAAAKTAVLAGSDYKDPRGIYYSPKASAPLGKVAFSFPGQGSQSPGMLNDLAVTYNTVRQVFEEADRSLGMRLNKPLSNFIFPPPVFTSEAMVEQESALKQTNIAQPALGAADLAMFRLLTELGIAPDMACGHSYGEFAALCAAGTFSVENLIRISELRGRVIIESAKDELGTMAAVEGNEAQVKPLIENVADVVIANLNGPSQTVISGTRKGVDEAVALLQSKGLKARAIPVACAFHSPLVAGATEPLLKALRECAMKPPRFTVYSNTSAKPHVSDVQEIGQLLADHLSRPVRFVDEILAMHNAGARIFVECGPGKVLTGLVANILKDKPHVAITMDQPGRHGLLHMAHSLAQLAVAGVPFFAWRLFEGRVTRNLKLDRLVEDTAPKPLSATAWVVTNGRVLPAAKLNTPGGSRVPNNSERKANRNILLKSNSSVEHPIPMSSSNYIPVTQQPAPAATPAVATNQLESVLQGHHRLMNQFLETHRKVMMAALNQPVAASATPVVMQAYAATAAQPLPSYTQPASVAPVASIAPIVSLAPTPPVKTVAPVTNPTPAKARFTRQDIIARLVDLVSQRTGYPPDMLGLDLDLEADLGVDSIKRVEIFGALQNESVLPESAFEGQIEVLSKLKTLNAIIDWVEAKAAELTGGITTVGDAPVPASAKVQVVTREEIARRLIDLVSQRTGYPPDMLGLELDLEADLGVDSIKRVEIFGALQNESVLPEAAFEGQIETLSKLKTLKAIIDWVEVKAGEVIGAAVEAPVAVTVPLAIAAPEPPPDLPVTRMVVEVVDAPAASRGSVRPGFVLITDDDGTGVATSLAARLTQLGIDHAVVGHNPLKGVDLTDPDTVVSLLARLREKHGKIEGLVHLMPLAPVLPAEALDLETRTHTDLKSLFLFTKYLERDLRGSGVVLAATRLGGAFGFACGIRSDSFAGNGAISGFVKTVVREWSDVSARTVDFGQDADAETVARLLSNELLCRDGLSEVGYLDGQRKMLRSEKSPLGEGESGIHLDSDCVVMLTGGARGITASIAIELAREFRPKIVLVGRSPLPAEREPDDIADIIDTKQLKAALMDRMQTGGQRPTPALIEGALKRVKNEREMRHSIAALEAAGSTVEYVVADVADRAAMADVIDHIYEKYGRLDGVVHGAGIIEDKLISDKTSESFDRVIRPKIAGAMSLIRRIRPEKLQFLIFFSSVSARYGNRGQCDYSAANEVLDKLALQLNSQWPGRVLSINWGPWRTEGGMVSADLAKRFAAAGVEMIGVPDGCRAFMAELTRGAKADAEVVFGGPLSLEHQTPAFTAAQSEFPLARKVVREPNGAVHARVETDAAKHGFLYDHAIEGKPVLPFVMALEMIAESATAARPGVPLTAIRNLKMLQGISYAPDSSQTLLVESASGEEYSIRKSDSGPVHYRATVEYAGPRRTPPPRLELVNPRAFPLSIEDAYAQWLFHGPKIGGILTIDRIGDNGIIGRLRTSTPDSLMHPGAPGNWIADPAITDSSLQLCVVWARAIFDQTPLPAGMDLYSIQGSFEGLKEVHCEMEILSRKGSPTLRTRPVYYDDSGRVIAWMEGMEATMSKGLNRLSSAKGRGAAV